ncbi:MAG: CpaF family protein [Candidatus Diapherotrites archaeon]|uniref:CpaF family protein n=1 Tax=Candidatus Iainarchaeum sp. TaxID=3101447 RepID=A0A939C6C0_9ARCH|nr:CpaF family protein [Candidatus Diapherotrites archaeon]
MEEVKGNLLQAASGKRVFEAFPYNTYEILAPSFTESERKLAKLFIDVILRRISLTSLSTGLQSERALVEEFRSKVVQLVDVNELVSKLPSTVLFSEILGNFEAIAKQLGVSSPKQFASYVLNHSIGYRELSELMQDPDLEEIMVNGFDRNVFVTHRKFGNCKTGIVATERGFLQQLISRIAATVNKQFNESHPLLDARLPDGSRANATFSYATPFGHTLTIRKFTKVPLSIVNLIENNTLSSKVAAFLWCMVEGLGLYPMNLIVTGGAGSGKTTFMNVLAVFIPFKERIITIEDTVELDLAGRMNWIQMESKPKIRDLQEISMDDLLKNSLRMRPDRILVGEVRGREAQTLFVAMDTGHRGILGTLHSNTAREMMLRLKSPPMSVEEQMLPLLDLAVVMQRTFEKSKGVVRRVKQVSEIARMDEKVLLSNVFEYNDKSGRIGKTDVPSHVIETLAEKCGLSKNELKREMLVREKLLEWMIARGITLNSEVETIVQQYYFNPEGVLQILTAET